MKKESALVIFTKKLPRRKQKLLQDCGVVIASKTLRDEIEALDCRWIDLDELIVTESIYEASAFAEELSRLTLADESRLAKAFMYKGYELWWTHYDTLFFNFCLPYTQHKRLLEYLKSFQSVILYGSSHKDLFLSYLNAYTCKVSIVSEEGLKKRPLLPFGVFLQIIITFISIPILALRNRSIMVYTSDEFDKSGDYNFRMRFIYEELQRKNLPFVECIRSIEPWKTVVAHALKRKRPVIYTDTAAFIGRFLSGITGGRRSAKRRFGVHMLTAESGPDDHFKFLVASHYLLFVYDDIWAIRIMKYILRVIGVKSALIITAMGRNFPTVLGCKLNNIPTVGIMHGVQSRYYNLYDFMPTYDGEKILSVDTYGVWSEWWREYYLKHSNAYRKEQLVVSGPMMPLKKINTDSQTSIPGAVRSLQGKINVLFVSETVAVPSEVLPYLKALIEAEDFSVHIKFRSYYDSFQEWLEIHCPEILASFDGGRILKGSMHEAIELCDVVVGSQSTGVIEATLKQKPFVFFNTKKWGDYFDMKSSDFGHDFFAENPEELIRNIRNSDKIPKEMLSDFCKKFFGDPQNNGSAWAVDQVEKNIK